MFALHIECLIIQINGKELFSNTKTRLVIFYSFFKYWTRTRFPSCSITSQFCGDCGVESSAYVLCQRSEFKSIQNSSDFYFTFRKTMMNHFAIIFWEYLCQDNHHDMSTIYQMYTNKATRLALDLLYTTVRIAFEISRDNS